MEWAYVAGFVDFDGTVGLVQRKSGKHKGQIDTRMCFTNGNKQVLLATRDFLDLENGVYVRAQNATWPYRQPNYYLQFGGFGKIKRVLENCLPYLIVKKDVAELVLRFATSRLSKMRQMRKGTGGRVGYSEEELTILKQVRSLQGRKGSKGRLEVSQHPQNHTNGQDDNA